MKITRSFFRKKNLGNYQTCDFGISIEDECEENEFEETSKHLHNLCIEEVNKAIKEFEEELEYEVEKKLNFNDVKLDGN